MQYRACRKDRPAITVRDRNEAIHPRLNSAFQAMHAGHTGKNNVQDLEFYFKTADNMNQRETVCSLEMVTDPTLPSRQGGMSAVLSGLNAFRRLQLPAKLADEFTAARAELDRMIARYWWRMAGTIDMQTFWPIFYLILF